MYYLSIESSTKDFALSISRDDKILNRQAIKQSQRLEDIIIKSIDALLLKAKVPFKKVDAYVVSLGPGSFTSLRVGLATLKAFCLATQKPLVGIGTLEVIAYGVEDEDCDEICVLVDARRNLVYSAIYKKTSKGLKLTRSFSLSPLNEVLDDVCGKTLFVGDALALYRADIEKAYARSDSATCKPSFAKENQWLPNVSILAQLGFRRIIKKDYDDAQNIVPIYLYEDDCQVKPRK